MTEWNRSLFVSPVRPLRCAAALASLLLFVGAAGAWDADLDPTYHSGGTSWVGFHGGVGNSESAVAVAVQANGKVVMAGSRDDGSSLDFSVVRLGLDGFPDYTFGFGAATAYYDFDSATDTARDVVIQPDGKIVVVGTATVGGVKRMGVVRFNHDGSLDGTATVPFSGPAYGLGAALQPDGKIVVSGRHDYGNGWDFAVARLNPNLTMDTTFSSDGMAEWDFGEGDDSAADIAVRADGRIVVAGTAIWGGQSVFGLMVFSASGGPLSLGVATFAEDAYGFALDLQEDGKAVVSGRCETYGGDFAVARFNTNGTIDTTFGTGGMATVSHLATEQESAMDVVVQHNGKIVVSGYLSEGGQEYLALVRWKSDGALDWTFDSSTAFYTYVEFFAGYDSRGYAICQQPDGKILAAGYTDYASGRLLAVARFMGDEDLIFAEDFDNGTTDWWSSTLN